MRMKEGGRGKEEEGGGGGWRRRAEEEGEEDVGGRREKVYRRLLFVRPGGGSLLFLQYQEKRTLSTRNEICQTLAGERYLDPVCHLHRNPQYRRLEIRVRTINETPMTCR